MQNEKNIGQYFPVQDFMKASKLLQRLDWSNRVMAAMIRSGYLGGYKDRQSGLYFTSKKEILEALDFRNRLNKVVTVDLVKAEMEIPQCPYIIQVRKKTEALQDI